MQRDTGKNQNCPTEKRLKNRVSATDEITRLVIATSVAAGEL